MLKFFALLFSVNLLSAEVQFPEQRPFVDLLQETWAENIRHLESGSNNRLDVRVWG